MGIWDKEIEKYHETEQITGVPKKRASSNFEVETISETVKVVSIFNTCEFFVLEKNVPQSDVKLREGERLKNVETMKKICNVRSEIMCLKMNLYEILFAPTSWMRWNFESLNSKFEVTMYDRVLNKKKRWIAGAK